MIKRMLKVQAIALQRDQIQYTSPDEQEKYCTTPYKDHPQGCPDLGHNWGCPPFAPTGKETQNTLETYPYVYFLVTEIVPSSSRIHWWQHFQTMRKYNKLTSEFNTFLAYLQQSNPEWAVYFSSLCTLCKDKFNLKCTCPESPCRYPNELRLSPEAAGVNVFKTMQILHEPIEVQPTNRLRRIGMVACDSPLNITEILNQYELYLQVLHKLQGE